RDGRDAGGYLRGGRGLARFRGLAGEAPGRVPVNGGSYAASRLRDVYWIGGGSGAGKSTIARRLAARHGLRLYATDEVMADHGRRTSPVDSPFMARFAAMDMDERLVSRSPPTMLETFGWFPA